VKRIPRLTGEQVVRALRKSGFFIHHQKGSHVTLRYREDINRRTVVPVHKGKTLGKGLLSAIIKDAGLTVEEFKKLL